MSIIVRYKLDENLKEDFLGFFNTHKIAEEYKLWGESLEKKLTGKIIGQIVEIILKGFDLDLKRCVSYGSDGAAVLTSKEKED